MYLKIVFIDLIAKKKKNALNKTKHFLLNVSVYLYFTLTFEMCTLLHLKCI